MVHSVWGTKNRKPVLDKERRDIILDHIRQNARTKDIYIDTIGGYIDHVHCLISFGAEQSIAKVIQLLKGESSFWTNRQGLIKPKLEWPDDYLVESVSKESVQRVRDYINQQEEHHKKISFNEEYEKLLKEWNFKFG